MPLAAALGLCGGEFARDGLRLPAVDPERVALVGVRSLDPGEQALVRELGIAVYTISDLDRRGVEPVIDEALARVAGGSFVHVSVDLDVVDPEFAPGVGDPVSGRALVPRGAPRARARRGGGRAGLARARRGEPDPRPREHDRGLAVGLAASALGVRIL